jgi:hypothetical protein
MSEIPFVTALGDAFEAAIGQPAKRRRRPLPRRPLAMVAFAAVLLAGGGLALARLLDNPEKLAANSVACYDRASLGANVAVPNGVSSPLEACAGVYRDAGRPVPPLVACANKDAVAVFPGSGADVCRRLGLDPLPAGYGAARARVGQLQSGIRALEGAADCVAPSELASRVQALLDRSGWTGWRTQLRPDLGQGPCGSVSGLGGDGRRSIAGALDATQHVVLVSSAPYRSTERLLWGPSGLAPSLEDDSGTRCFSEDAMRAEASRRVAPSGRSVSFAVQQTRPPGETFIDARERLYQAGCTIIVDVTPARDGLGVVVTLLRRH